MRMQINSLERIFLYTKFNTFLTLDPCPRFSAFYFYCIYRVPFVSPIFNKMTNNNIYILAGDDHGGFGGRLLGPRLCICGFSPISLPPTEVGEEGKE
jgi:hypothetical protein